jgi:hypothetical protein
LLKRARYYQRFLNAVLRSDDLKTFTFLDDFLKNHDQKHINKELKKLAEMKIGRGLNELCMAKGKAKVQMSNNSAMICSKYSDITDTYQFLNKELIDASKEIDMKCQELSLLFHNFKKQLEQLSTLNKSIKGNVLHEVY